MPKIGILIHVYYDDTLMSIYKQISSLLREDNVYVFLNISRENPYFHRASTIIEKRYPKIYLIGSTNKGKDIGGKLALIDMYLRCDIKCDYLVFLHDKKSPQLLEGNLWQDKLFNIINKEKINSILTIFEDESIGMIGNKENIMSKKTDPESKIFVNKKEFTLDLAKKYSIQSDDYEFVGGTMFWVRESVYRSFFTEFSPLQIRKTLEYGNVMDDFGPTITHSWERLLGWIITSKGFKIAGI